MPFGLTKAGSVYSRMLDVAMKEVDRDFWTSYLDDILTFSGEPWTHFGHLAQVVQAHGAPGIKIQPCKTKLFQSEVEYLGHKISKKVIKKTVSLFFFFFDTLYNSSTGGTPHYVMFG